MIINFGFGRPQRQQVWNNRHMIVYGRVSQGVLPVAPVMQPLTDTIDNMFKPVNAILIGHQTNKTAIGLEGIPSSMRGIFGE